MWPQSHRSVPLALFTVASFCGPVLAPIIGGFLTQYASWRWGFWLVVIISSIVYAFIVLVLPETYAPRLVELKTAKTSSDALVSHGPLKDRFIQNLVRPWIMLFTEPILFPLSLYMAFLYGVLFLDFSAYPVVFQLARGWSVSISGLSFLGIGIGMAFAAILSPQVNRLHSHFVRKLGPLPEARLPHLIGIAWLLPVGLFWFGWTALPPTHWVVSIIGGVPFGFGLVMVFLGINSYLTDCYDRFSASALAANTMLRSLFGAGFALFANDMYQKLGTPWATSLLGFFAVAMTVLPFIFFKYGSRLRAVSRFHIMTRQMRA
ncbi:hypothetical protein DL764_009963 [Monosporascus ibericus]|uniref:Major facilitator superfamily (MFS) profile domain-containing protein n=1 Tax=Monosporascus ibericus TaxID=155417 RepID=A0A4Q4STM9_9PEZI|nr:hypothetical protein DL764_009963 [Monosporascus ibericus]